MVPKHAPGLENVVRNSLVDYVAKHQRAVVLSTLQAHNYTSLWKSKHIFFNLATNVHVSV